MCGLQMQFARTKDFLSPCRSIVPPKLGKDGVKIFTMIVKGSSFFNAA